MAKLASKVVIPMFLVGIFGIVVFVALDYEKLDLSFYIVFLLFIVYVFFFGISTGQSLTTPIKKILERAEELSKGNLSSRVYLETKDELSELAKAFNKIAEELEASQAQEESTEKSVDIKVRARTQALEETIDALEQKIRNRTAELQNMIKSLEKFQGESTIKELEIANLRKEIKSLGESTKRQRKKEKPATSEVVEDNIENA